LPKIKLLALCRICKQLEQSEAQQSKANLWQVIKKIADGKRREMLIIAGGSWQYCKFLTLHEQESNAIFIKKIKKDEKVNF